MPKGKWGNLHSSANMLIVLKDVYHDDIYPLYVYDGGGGWHKALVVVGGGGGEQVQLTHGPEMSLHGGGEWDSAV